MILYVRDLFLSIEYLQLFSFAYHGFDKRLIIIKSSVI